MVAVPSPCATGKAGPAYNEVSLASASSKDRRSKSDDLTIVPLVIDTNAVLKNLTCYAITMVPDVLVSRRDLIE